MGNILRYLLILVGVAVDLFVAVMVLGFLVKANFAEFPILLFFLLCGAGGTLLITSNVKKIKQGQYQIQEKKILKLIKKLGGKVSPIEIATETEMTANEAEDVLRRLCHSGYGEEQIAANDSVVYVFDGFLTESDRSNSKRLLDV